MMAMTQDFEGHIRATLASGGAQVTALRQGYLMKRSSGMRREWKRRYFVLDSQGQLYYYSGKVRLCAHPTLALCMLPLCARWHGCACPGCGHDGGRIWG